MMKLRRPSLVLSMTFSRICISFKYLWLLQCILHPRLIAGLIQQKVNKVSQVFLEVWEGCNKMHVWKTLSSFEQHDAY